MKIKNIIVIVIITLISVISIDTYAKDPGDTVDDFTIDNYDGVNYALSEVKDAKAVVIMFWATECPYVQPFNDRINEFVKEYQDKGFVFWAINSNNTESVERVIEHAKINNYVFPMLKDNNNVVADIFEATRTPEVFVLDNNRTILYHGRIEDSSHKEKVSSYDLKTALDEILEGKDITVKSTKSFGCTIKRNDN
ncbi:MAG: redoxin domain-containing protein [Ignavibacteria bacterium]|nr:redoxin domain-containing protein [Ignavibacteria bacterium]